MSAKKNKTRAESVRQSILALLLFAFSILLILSLLKLNIGFFGRWLRTIFTSAFGAGTFVFAILLLMFSGLSIVRDDVKDIKLYTLSGILFFALLLLFDSQNTSNYSLLSKLMTALDLASTPEGAGVVGGFFGYFFRKILGDIGTIIFVVLLIIVSFIMITELTVSEFFKLAKNKVKIPKNSTRTSKNTQTKTLSENKMIQKKERKKEVVKLPVLEVGGFGESSGECELDVPDFMFKDLKNSRTHKPKIPIIKETKPPESSFDFTETEEIFNEDATEYKSPPVSLLKRQEFVEKEDNSELLAQGERIVETLRGFHIESKFESATVGPTVTNFEISPSAGVKLSKIVSLADNIALALAAGDIRIEAPIPGKSVVGIEVPNRKKTPVLLSEIIGSNDFKESSNLPLPLGKDVGGNLVISSLNEMPHLLIAGQTGSGKSVCINALLVSLLYRSSPEKVRLILIDPKVVELQAYNDIPHLLIPVVTDAKKASLALGWAVGEMERRYMQFADKKVRDITTFNSLPDENMPYIIIVIDELSDLMMVASKEVESSIIRLAQMARAAGIFLVIATQRPSVNVITGIIKANIPSRISFAVSSQVDSRTILDMAGAEKLLGKGDMLFYPSFYSKPQRIQGAFVSDKEIEEVAAFVREQNPPSYNDDAMNSVFSREDSETI